MAGGKEIRTKIKSVQNTRKITKAMEMVAASKMRKAQERMRAARPYSEKIRQLAANLSQANNTEYHHPFLSKREPVKRVGLIVVTTDKGLCGGLNTNVLRMSLNAMRKWESEVSRTSASPPSATRASASCSASVPRSSRTSSFWRHAAPGKADRTDQGHGRRLPERRARCHLRCIHPLHHTMKQEPVLEQLLPLTGERLGTPEGSWEYLYEPEARIVIDEMLVRYTEALIYQAVAENMASEQSARMVAMKSATDNAGNVIKELQLIYNKARQAAITKEISEIVSGAAAV